MSNVQNNTSLKSVASNKLSIHNPPTHRSPPPSVFTEQPSRRVVPSVYKSSATPRGQQTEKSRHKQSHRYRFADEDAIVESANMQTSKKGRTSITHLIDFHSTRPTQQQLISRYGQSRSHVRRNPTWGLGSGYHAADKARYVHANYRFIVDPRGDYRAQSTNADVHLDWKDVLQILASPSTQATSCPICLDSPVSPRMARCGHIFCLPCAIRFMHSDDDERPAGPEKRARSKSCPICHDSIYISELRPVRWYDSHEDGVPLVEGADVVLRLIKRAVGSTLAMPRESPSPLTKISDVPWHSAAEVMDHARFIRGGASYMIEQYDHEIAAITSQGREDEIMFGDSGDWCGRSVRMLEEAKVKVKDMGDPPTVRIKPEKPKPPTTADLDLVGNESHQDSGSSQNGIIRLQPRVEVPPDHYYFYQAYPNLYLSSLDIRILKDAFGTYEAFPSSLLPRIERISAGHVIDDDMRRRAKYLSHLPHGCEVGFLECDWTDTISPQILDKYKKEIERRRTRNVEKEAREEKDRAAAERARDLEYMMSAAGNLSIQPPDTLSTEHFQALGVNAATDDGTSIDVPIGLSPRDDIHRPNGSAYGLLASPGTSPNTMRTVWGTNVVASAASPDVMPLDIGPVDDGWLQGWEDELMHPDEQRLIAQAEASSLSAEDSASPAPQLSKGKKKAKKITLMSTSARRVL